jgi:hypothetical protein
MVPVFKQAKTFHALDRAATAIVLQFLLFTNYHQRDEINEADMSSTYGMHWAR